MRKSKVINRVVNIVDNFINLSTFAENRAKKRLFLPYYYSKERKKKQLKDRARVEK